MDVKDLTQEEIDLLLQAYTDTDRITKGDLLSYEKEVVTQIRFGKEYLKRKYPGTEFILGDLIPKSRFRSVTTLAMWTEEGGERYELEVTIDPEGVCSAQDSYYGALIREEYGAKLASLGETSGAGCLGAWASVPYLYGEGYDAGLTLESLLEKGMKLSAVGAVCYDAGKAPSSEETCSALKNALESAGLKGEFNVYFLKELPEGGSAPETLRTFVNEKQDSVLAARERILLS